MAGKRFLLIKGFAGLGNRTLATVSGLLYAELTGRRPIVDWRDTAYSDDGSDVFGRLFHAPSAGSPDEIPTGASVWPGAWDGHLHTPPRALIVPRKPISHRALNRLLCADLTRLDHPAEVLVMWATRDRIDLLRPHLRGEHSHWADMPTGAIVRELLNTRMRPHQQITAHVERFRDRHLTGRTVGVHVRGTDLRTRVGAIRRRLERLLAGDPGLQVFLATDNRAVRDEFEQRYGAVTTPHRYADPGETLHDRHEGPGRYELAVDALVDLLLLARCEHLVGDSKSSFSRLAMILSDAPPEHRHDVQWLPGRWHLPPKAVWRRVVPGPAAPAAVAVARRLV